MSKSAAKYRRYSSLSTRSDESKVGRLHSGRSTVGDMAYILVVYCSVRNEAKHLIKKEVGRRGVPFIVCLITIL